MCTDRIGLTVGLLIAMSGGMLPVSAERPLERRLSRLLHSGDTTDLHQAIVWLEGDPSRCKTALRALTDIAQTRIVACEKRRSSDVDGATIRLVQLIGSVQQPQAVEWLVSQLSSSRPEVVMLSAGALGTNNHRKALDDLIELTRHPAFAESYGFRFSVLRAIAQIDDPRRLEFLIETLPELDGQLEFEVDRVVSELEQGRPRDQVDYRQRASGQLVLAKQRRAMPTYDDPRYYRRPRQATYYGIGIHAKRLVFAIDCSQSMSAIVYNETRLQRAKRELIDTINDLAEDTHFTIVVYGTRVDLWRASLVPAMNRNKRQATSFVGSLPFADATNTYGALCRSLQTDDNLEAIFLLSDGEPTSGELVNPAEIIRAISGQNMFRNVTINTIGVDVQGEAQLFMQALAQQNGGEHRIVN